MKGAGHELSDFSKIMSSVKTWHREFKPKLEFNYFASRVRRTKKETINEHMAKVRKVFKGEIDARGVLVERESEEEKIGVAEVEEKEDKEKF